MSVPQITTCPDCFMADDVTSDVDYMTHEWVFTCHGNKHGDIPFIWRKTPPADQSGKQYRDGYFAELGVYDVLLKCIKPDDPWVEYGIVEDRFRRLDPDLYAKLVGEFSHSARHWKRGGPDLNPVRIQTVSMRLSRALGVLRSEGLISFMNASATGYWDYLDNVSHWAPVPAPLADQMLTWATYAKALGIDPEKWVLP